MALLDSIRRRLGSGDTPTTNGLIIAEGFGPRRIVLSGDRVATYEALYESQPPVAATVNKLSRQIATLPLEVCRKRPDGSVERVEDHPLERLIKNPAPRAGEHSLGQWLSLPALVFGNSLLVKVRNAEGQVIGLLPVDWRYVNAYARMGGPVEMWSTIQTGEELFFAPSEAVHCAWEGLRGGLGVSPLSQLDSTLRIEDSARRYQISSFDKGVRPSGILTLDKDVDPQSEQGKRIRQALKKLNEGVDNAGQVMLLGGGAAYEKMSHTAVEAELILQRKLNREEVAMVYDVPPPLIGDLEHGTYSNVEELHRQLYKTTLRPWLQMIASTLNSQLVRVEPDWQDLFVRFDLSDVLRGDPAEERRSVAELVTKGIIDTNEARKMLGLNPRPEPEADRLLVQANNVAPLEELSQSSPKPAQ